MIIDSQYIEKNGMKGKACEIMHYYNDFLWFFKKLLLLLLKFFREIGNQELYPIINDNNLINNNENNLVLPFIKKEGYEEINKSKQECTIAHQNNNDNQENVKKENIEKKVIF